MWFGLTIMFCQLEMGTSMSFY